MPHAVGTTVRPNVVTAAAWTPATALSGNLPLAWWDASDTATITASSSRVSQWNDKANAYHFTQGTGGNQPLTGGTLGGLNVIEFSKARSDFMGVNPGVGSAQYVTGFHVYALNGTNSYALMDFGVDNMHLGWYPYSDDDQNIQNYDGSSPTINLGRVPATGEVQMFRSRLNSSGTQLHVTNSHHDDVSGSASWSPGAGSIPTIYIGRSRAPDRYFNGYFCESLHYATNLSDADVTTVEGYLQTKWGCV